MLHQWGLYRLSGNSIASLGQERVDPVGDSFLLGKADFVEECAEDGHFWKIVTEVFF